MNKKNRMSNLIGSSHREDVGIIKLLFILKTFFYLGLFFIYKVYKFCFCKEVIFYKVNDTFNHLVEYFYQPGLGTLLIVFMFIFTVLFFRAKGTIATILSLIVIYGVIGLILIYLGTDFLGLIYLIIIAGGLSILYLLAVMLLELGKEDRMRRSAGNRNKALSFFFGLGAVLVWQFLVTKPRFLDGFVELDRDQRLIDNLQLFEGAQLGVVWGSFYLAHYVLVILTGVVLLLGLLGPIVIAYIKKYSK